MPCGSNALETWLQKPAFPCMREQQTGLQVNKNWSKMKKKKKDTSKEVSVHLLEK